MSHAKPDNSRYIYAYLPSREDKKRWENAAEKRGYKSLSRFVFDQVETSLRRGVGEPEVRLELLKRIQELDAELSAAREREKRNDAYIRQVEEELRRHRADAVAPFLGEPRYRAARRYDVRLVEILRERKKVRNDDLHRLLGVDPRDAQASRALYLQLGALHEWKLIAPVPDGWRWTG